MTVITATISVKMGTMNHGSIMYTSILEDTKLAKTFGEQGSFFSCSRLRTLCQEIQGRIRRLFAAADVT